MPGLIDLNVSVSHELSSVTKQASSGGVTTIATTGVVASQSPHDHPVLFTNIAPIDTVFSATSNSWATKVFLDSIPEDFSETSNFSKPVLVFPQSGSNSLGRTGSQSALDQSCKLSEIVQELLVPFEEPRKKNCQSVAKASWFTLESDEEDLKTSQGANDDESCDEGSEGGDSPDSSGQNRVPVGSESESEDGESDREEPLIVVTDCGEGTRALPFNKRGSVPLTVNKELAQLKLISSPRHFSIQVSGHQRPVPLQDLPFIAKGVKVTEAYSTFSQSFPPDLEKSRISSFLSLNPKCPVHFCSISSIESIKLLQKSKKLFPQLTFETSTPYLYFSTTDVKPGDARYKLSPPIRDHENFLQLWAAVKNSEIDSISSYHQPVAPPDKFIGDFFKAKTGVASIGFTLQALWTRLRSQISIQDEGRFIARLASMLSETPAKVLKMQHRGSISIGKNADFVVWDPHAKFCPRKSFDRFPEMSPMIGEEMYGVVHKTYVSGKLVYSSGFHFPGGTILECSN